MNKSDTMTRRNPVGQVSPHLGPTARREWQRATDRQFRGWTWLDHYGACRLFKVWSGWTPRTGAPVVAVARYNLAGKLEATTFSGNCAAQVLRAVSLTPPAEPPHQDLAAAQTSGGEGGTDAAV